MSQVAPLGDTATSALTYNRTQIVLKLPPPKPDGENPFRVIDWILFTVTVAARQIYEARMSRVEQLGRLMRTEDGGSIGRFLESQLDDLIASRWLGALREARQLSAKFGIPFSEYDPVLQAAKIEYAKRWSIIRGRAPNDELDFPSIPRLDELADSTTVLQPFRDTNVTPLLSESTKPSEGAKPAAGSSKGKNVEGKMLKTMADNPESHGWTQREWARHCDCSPSTIGETKTWKESLKRLRAMNKFARAERAAGQSNSNKRKR